MRAILRDDTHLKATPCARRPMDIMAFICTALIRLRTNAWIVSTCDEGWIVHTMRGV